MFPFKIHIVVSALLGGLIAVTAPLQACQSFGEHNANGEVSSRRKRPDNRLRTSVQTVEFKDTSQVRRKLKDVTQRTISDNQHKLSDATLGTPATQRKLTDAHRSLTDQVRTLTDYSQQQQEMGNLPTVGSELRILSSRRRISDAKISNVQLTLTDAAAPSGQPNLRPTKAVNHSTGEAYRTKLIASVAQHKNATPIGTNESVSQNQQTTFADPQEQEFQATKTAGTSEYNRSTRRNAHSHSGFKQDTVVSRKPNFVNPESFRVLSNNDAGVSRTMENGNAQKGMPIVGSGIPSNVGRIHSASVRRNSSWSPQQQGDIETDMPSLDISVMESATTENTRNFSDSTAMDEDRVDLDDLGKINISDASANLPPVSDINQRPGFDPLMRAFGAHTIGDPYVASRSLAPEYRLDATQKIKTWRTPNLKHRPLYFEDAALERHGQSLPKLQPVVSGARFLSSIALLPQKVLATPPSECVHPLGYGRPGDCMNKVRETLPRRGE